MPGSSEKGKATIAKWFQALPHITLVLDVGAGWGTYVKLLRREGQTWHAVEVFKPYIKKFGLEQLYERVFIADMRQFIPAWEYDVVICGDVLEHIYNYEAVKVMVKLLHYCKFLIVSLPLDAETNAPSGTGDVDWHNIHELHRGRWSHELFENAISKIGARIVDFSRFQEIAVYLIEPIQGQLVDDSAITIPFISGSMPCHQSEPDAGRSIIHFHTPLGWLSRQLRKLPKYWTLRSRSSLRVNPQREAAENWHESFIEHLATVLKPRVYVELGLYRCELFNRIIPHAQRLIGVDINAEAGNWMAKSDKVQFVHSTTDEFTAALRAHPMLIDMLFIDAGHSKEAVLRDFWNFFPFVSPHGIIILHDTHPKNNDYIQPEYCGDAYKVVEELSRHTDQFEMMTIPVHPGLTLCRKRTTQLSWTEVGIY